MEVLIATDGSEDATSAARRALELFSNADRVAVLCVGEEPPVATSGFESGFAGGVGDPVQLQAAWETANEAAASAIERTVAAVSTDATIESVVETGPPGPVICEVAEARGSDVVVVGSRGRGAVRRALLGSVSTHVVHHAPCPVMVIRAQ
jgi:nucleotide-binding universal stress UspA family protein